MSEIKEFKPRYLPNATTISNDIESFPNVKHFLELLVANVDVVTKHVGRSFMYTEDVERNRYYGDHGLFMDYFLRKQLANQYNMEIISSRTEIILDDPDKYIIGKNIALRDAIKRHYEIFKDPKTMAIDIIKSIKIVSLSHTIFFHRPLPEKPYTVNEDNLREVVRYLKNLPYKSVDINPSLGCDYFNADADFIFDNDVIYEIKTSKFKSLLNGEHEVPLSKFYQPIIYGFGFYKKTGTKVENFKIYNPLLGHEHSIKLDNIDFELFEKVLKRDVSTFSRMEEILNDEMVLDLSLFSVEGEEIELEKMSLV